MFNIRPLKNILFKYLTEFKEEHLKKFYFQFIIEVAKVKSRLADMLNEI